MSRMNKPAHETIDVQQLVVALLRERETTPPARDPAANRIAEHLPPPLRGVPAPIPAASPTSVSFSVPADVPESLAAELAQNILAENLSLREPEPVAPVGYPPE